jgi:hypothetical protein
VEEICAWWGGRRVFEGFVDAQTNFPDVANGDEREAVGEVDGRSSKTCREACSRKKFEVATRGGGTESLGGDGVAFAPEDAEK